MFLLRRTPFTWPVAVNVWSFSGEEALLLDLETTALSLASPDPCLGVSFESLSSVHGLRSVPPPFLFSIILLQDTGSFRLFLPKSCLPSSFFGISPLLLVRFPAILTCFPVPSLPLLSILRSFHSSIVRFFVYFYFLAQGIDLSSCRRAPWSLVCDCFSLPLFGFFHTFPSFRISTLAHFR